MIVEATPERINKAARHLLDGGLVAFPTETVYGLGADATSALAVAAIFDTKHRPQLNPLIVHGPDLESVARLGVIEGPALALAQAFWPGPLTLVVPRRPAAGVADLTTAGLDTVALRVPAHPVAQALLRAAQVPIAAPSANVSGAMSPTEAAHVHDSFAHLPPRQRPWVLDGGRTHVGVESTIVGFRSGKPVVLRPGGIARDDLRSVCGPLAAAVASSKVTAPGQLARHYAPKTPLRLNARDVAANEGLLAFGDRPPTGAARTLNLSEGGHVR
ncbi:MAG: L-threonylcarbamoyladenylate synthase, partial [Pseudomonadota bacterium]